ncbi:1960_t:CDS:2 [Funneliformis geosporum]|uniref:543_t:CDS:1 n=1 Tax=Funneliformis geosporum TaxID=1117311 RepID=A0A9W4T1Z0_9GLOM|nr:543_t:CDS:2 [Funneliformis geosporum]CAI2189038.1 1960_t:CDS:2 [Funneliformis geosporum]
MSYYRDKSSNAHLSHPNCRNFSNGNCNRGTSCHFLHKEEDNNSHSNNGGSTRYNHSNAESSSSTLQRPNSNSNRHSAPSVCRFFLENRWLYGDSCWNKLEKPDNVTKEVNSTSADSQKNDLKNQKNKQKAKEEYICGICLETPKVFGLFGLLLLMSPRRVPHAELILHLLSVQVILLKQELKRIKYFQDVNVKDSRLIN